MLAKCPIDVTLTATDLAVAKRFYGDIIGLAFRHGRNRFQGEAAADDAGQAAAAHVGDEASHDLQRPMVEQAATVFDRGINQNGAAIRGRGGFQDFIDARSADGRGVGVDDGDERGGLV